MKSAQPRTTRSRSASPAMSSTGAVSAGSYSVIQTRGRPACPANALQLAGAGHVLDGLAGERVANLSALRHLHPGERAVLLMQGLRGRQSAGGSRRVVVSRAPRPVFPSAPGYSQALELGGQHGLRCGLLLGELLGVRLPCWRRSEPGPAIADVLDPAELRRGVLGQPGWK